MVKESGEKMKINTGAVNVLLQQKMTNIQTKTEGECVPNYNQTCGLEC